MAASLAHVRASSAAVEACLTSMLDLVQRSGGTWHPSLALVQSRGELSVECPPRTDAAIEIPTAMVIPVSEAVWAWDDESLRLSEAPPNLAGPQREMLDLFVDLYTVTGKAAWYRTAHPRGAGLPSALVAAISAARPRWGPDAGPEGFLRTRTLVLPGRAQATDTSTPRRAGLMPIVDLMNHHAESPGYDVTTERLRVRVSQPTGSSECFVRYHPVPDPLDLALNYGFVDTTATTAFSAPVTVEVLGLGTLQVTSRRPHLTTRATFPAVATTDDGLQLSHLVFDARHPDRTRAAISLAVQGAVRSRGVAPDAAAGLASEAIGAVVEANIAVLAAIEREAAVVDSPAARIVADAARAEARIIAAVA